MGKKKSKKAKASSGAATTAEVAAPKETDGLILDKEYATFCSISLSSEPRGSQGTIDEIERLQREFQRDQTKKKQHACLRGFGGRATHAHAGRRTCRGFLSQYCCGYRGRRPRRHTIRCFAWCALAFFLMGFVGVFYAIYRQLTTDQYLFVGAIVSFCFSMVVIICYLGSRIVRSHPNPLILSKSLIDLLLACLYIFEYSATEYASRPILLPFRIAALTQALLVCGEFWFFAMPIDLVQSITNPFTSYSHNMRMYWVYSMLSGLICGIVFWLLDTQEPKVVDPNATTEYRFFWFHWNTDVQGFFWHRWLSYHIWVLMYLIFGAFCISFVKRRLRRGLEETFDVRKRVLSNGLLTCSIYITWSSLILCMFAMTNSTTIKRLLGSRLFESLICVSAFLHSARGCLNIIVWLVVNAFSLRSVVLTSSSSSSCSRTATAGEVMATFPSDTASGSTTTSMSSGSSTVAAATKEEQELLLKPELNTALRKQMIQMATTGIVESVEHYHRLHHRILSNQTFHLDWQRSPQRELRQLSSSMSLSRVAATRNSTIQVVEANDRTSSPRFSFLPMSMKEMQFYDFQPRVFASIRHLYGIDDAEYVYAFRQTMNERISEGRSGAFVFNSIDRTYLVKSMTSQEKKTLLDLLPSYLRYLKWNPHTLLPRFFGFHAMKMYGQIFYFVVMGNILSTNEVIHRRYDIKGSWVDRNAPACVLGEKYRCSKCNRFFVFGERLSSCELTGAEHYPDIILRDNDLKKRLKVDPDTAAQLLKQLTRDSNFLASMGIMDYSLLIGIHYAQFTITDVRRETKDPVVDDEARAETTSATVVSSDQNGGLRRVVRDGTKPPLAKKTESNDTGRQLQLVNGRVLHRYQANQVSGPSTYYFGMVDILQQWTLSKQTERVYKTYLLKKDGRGISAIAPKPYAARFQQKMMQLFITTISEEDAARQHPSTEEDQVQVVVMRSTS